MGVIQITDSINANASVTISDSSPIAKAKLSDLMASTQEIVKSFDKPVDQSDISTVTFGGQFTSPSLLADIPTLKVKAGANCDLSVIPASSKLLFAGDGFSPIIPIASNECWVEFGVDVAAEGDLSASANGFGIAVKGVAGLSLRTYTRLSDSPLPPLKSAIVTALEAFSVACSPQAIRSQAVGTVNVCDVSGSVTVKGSYSVPIALDPLASAALPLNFTVSVAPAATAEVSGSLKIFGDFLVRSYKASASKLVIGVYKKRGTTLAVNLTAEGGIEIDSGTTDLLGAVLNAVLPGVDAATAGISDDEAGQLNDVISDALDRSIAISLNATCSATNTDEAAVVYEVDLDAGTVGDTDAALAAALKGDWTLLGGLKNVVRLRDIAVETKDRKEKWNVNLFGIYSAASVSDYLRKCTILRDDNGGLSIIDKVDASRISAASAPYLADADKLRVALAQDFIATASYVVIGSHLKLDLTIKQSYFVYARTMSVQQLSDTVALGTLLGVIPKGGFAEVLASPTPLAHASVNVSIAYDKVAVMSMFFADTAKRVPHTAEELEESGRASMVALLDPEEDNNAAIIPILQSSAAWDAMDDIGNTNAFGTIPSLQALSATERGVVTADWVSVAWWRNAMLNVAPVLADILSSVEASTAPDPTSDPRFMALRKKLAGVLGDVAKNTSADFVTGWGPAVMFALSGRHGDVTMDIAWNGNRTRFPASV